MRGSSLILVTLVQLSRHLQMRAAKEEYECMPCVSVWDGRVGRTWARDWYEGRDHVCSYILYVWLRHRVESGVEVLERHVRSKSQEILGAATSALVDAQTSHAQMHNPYSLVCSGTACITHDSLCM